MYTHMFLYYFQIISGEREREREGINIYEYT